MLHHISQQALRGEGEQWIVNSCQLSVKSTACDGQEVSSSQSVIIAKQCLHGFLYTLINLDELYESTLFIDVAYMHFELILQ